MDIDSALQSEIHLKIISFFHENPASIDSPRGISTWIREEKGKVKRALDDLAKLNVLIAHSAPSTTGYSYTRDPKIISKIEKFLNKKKRSA